MANTGGYVVTVTYHQTAHEGEYRVVNPQGQTVAGMRKPCAAIAVDLPTAPAVSEHDSVKAWGRLLGKNEAEAVASRLGLPISRDDVQVIDVVA